MKNIDRNVNLRACQIAMIELFNGRRPLTIFAKSANSYVFNGVLNLSLKHFVRMLEA